MRKYTVFLVALILVFIIISCSEDVNIKKQIEDAQILDESIVWFEEIEDRVIVFTKGSEGIRGNLLKKVDVDWRFEGIGPSVKLEEKNKFDWIYINLNKMDFPIVYGIASDNEIHKISIDNINKEVKTVDLEEGMKLWYVFMDGQEAKRFLLKSPDNVIGLSKSGEVLYKGKEKIKKQLGNVENTQPKEKIPFELNDIVSVSVHKGKDRILITENNEEYEKTIFLQGIRHVNDKAEADISSLSTRDEDIYYIRFN